MKTLSKYVFKKLFWHYISVTVLLVVIAWVTQSLKLFSKISSANISIADYLQISTLLAPYMLFNVMPISLIITIFSRINTLKHDNELIAIKSCGVNNKQIYHLFMPFIAFVIVLHMLISMIILPISHSKFEYRQQELRDNIGLSILQSEAFLDFNNVMIFINEVVDKNTISGILVFDNRDEEEVMFIAESGIIADNNELILKNGSRILKHKGGEQLMKFKKYTTNLNNLIGNNIIQGVDRNAQFIRELIFNNNNSKYYLKKLSMAFHRIFWPFLGGALAMLIVFKLGIAENFNRNSNWKNNIITATLVFIFFSIHMLAVKLGQKQLTYLMLVVVNFFLVFSAFIYRKRAY